MQANTPPPSEAEKATDRLAMLKRAEAAREAWEAEIPALKALRASSRSIAPTGQDEGATG
jgi:hypothetical protein